MAKFIQLDATKAGCNGSRPARVNLDRIAFITTAGDSHDPSHPAEIVFGDGSRLVVSQAVAEVAAAIDAASA